MKYLLDTNACVKFLNEPASSVGLRIERTPNEDMRLCSIVKAELLFGAQNSEKKEYNLGRFRKFLTTFASHDFDDAAAEVAGLIRADLRRRGTPIGYHDMLIAAIALANDLTVVTHNISEFGRVDGLRVEDWEA